MTIDDTLKTPRAYSLDPAVIAWVSQTALRLGSENGERVSDSKVVNDILTEAMNTDERIQKIVKPAKFEPALDTVRKMKAAR